MKKLKLMAGAISLLMCSWGNAAIIPSGIVNNVNVSSILDSGWSYLYRQNFGKTSSIASVFGGLKSSDWIYVTGIRNSDNVVLAGAAVTWGEFSTYTTLNATHNFNGAAWYYNGYSLGFTAIGDGITQSSADTSPYVNGNQGLSLHANYDQGSQGSYFSKQDYRVSPTYFGSGYRVGAVRGLNTSRDYDIAFLVVSKSEVPEPASLALIGLGLAGLGLSRRKSKQQ